MTDLPWEERLAQLPLRAIVAFAARCARRVQPLYRLQEMHVDFQRHFRAIDRALSIAEDFAAGGDIDSRTAIGAANLASTAAFTAGEYADTGDDEGPDSSEALYSAVHAAHAAADAVYAAAEAPIKANVSTSAAARTAAEAIDAAAYAAVDNAVDNAANADYLRLVKLNLGKPGEPGQPIDATERGPLGPLWPEGPPDWYVEDREWQRYILEELESIPSEQDELPDADTPKDSSPIAGPLTVYIDSDAYTPEEKGELLSLISDLYELETGDRLVIDSMGTSEYSEAPVPAGSPDERR